MHLSYITSTPTRTVASSSVDQDGYLWDDDLPWMSDVIRTLIVSKIT